MIIIRVLVQENWNVVAMKVRMSGDVGEDGF